MADETTEALLPEIKSPNRPAKTSEPPVEASSSPPKDTIKLPELPAMRPRITSRKPLKGNIEYELAQDATKSKYPERSYQAYARPRTQITSTNDWKKDPELSGWYKQVQKRKTDAQKKKIRQASQEANWIIERRETQMKNLRDRVKAEEAEARIREVQNVKNKLATERANRKTMFASSKEGAHTGKDLDEDENDGLTWRKTATPLERMPLHQQYAVWCSPGHFTTKTVRTKD